MSSTPHHSGDRASHPRHYPSSIPDSVWAPLAAALLVAIVGLLGVLARQPWLFPSLRPTAFLQAEQPEQPGARFYNTVVGHLHGLAAGLLAVWILNASAAPPVLFSHDLTPVRVWASVLAIALNLFFGFVLNASHPPAAATTLLVSLGGFKPIGRDILTIVIGVLIVAIAGEILRKFRLGERIL